jgi:hypothetical protein
MAEVAGIAFLIAYFIGCWIVFGGRWEREP